jgi:[protein-PII] uridylyltransferase
MGYASGPIEIAVEKFMKEYFINAREVGALTRIACAKLEAQKSILLPRGLDVFLPNSRRNIKNTDFVLDHGRLMFSDPLKIKNNPSMILQLFETAGRRNLDIHPDAFSAIDFRRNLMDGDFRRDPINSKIFLEI